jgi:hypothetical protein
MTQVLEPSNKYNSYAKIDNMQEQMVNIRIEMKIMRNN